MWNEIVGMKHVGAGHGARPGTDDSAPAALPRPRVALRPGPRGEGGVVIGAPAPGDTPHPRFVHVAAFVRSDAELFGAASTWVRAGIDAGDLVVVGGTPSFQHAVAEEFGDDDRVSFDDRVRPNGRRGPDAMSAVIASSEEAARSGSGRLRVLAQVDQPDDPRTVREFACLESASNLMPIEAPATTLCIYDERRLPRELLRTAEATHPNVLAGDGVRPSDGYVEPRDFVRSMPVPREPLQDSVPLLAVDAARSLADLRHALGAQLVLAVDDRDRRED